MVQNTLHSVITIFRCWRLTVTLQLVVETNVEYPHCGGGGGGGGISVGWSGGGGGGGLELVLDCCGQAMWSPSGGGAGHL